MGVHHMLADVDARVVDLFENLRAGEKTSFVFGEIVENPELKRRQAEILALSLFEEKCSKSRAIKNEIADFQMVAVVLAERISGTQPDFNPVQ